MMGKWLFILAAIFLSGCASMSSDFDTRASNAEMIISSGEVEGVINRIQLTEPELKLVQDAIYEHREFIMKWGAKAESGEKFDEYEMVQIQTNFRRVQRAYQRVETVVKNNFHRYSEPDRRKLMELQAEAKMYSSSFGTFIQLQNHKRALDESIKFGNTALKLLATVL